MKLQETFHERVVHLATRNPSKRDRRGVGFLFVPTKMMLRASHARRDGIGRIQSQSRAWIPEQHSSPSRNERHARFWIEVRQEQRRTASAAHRVLPRLLPVLGEDGPSDVVCIPNAAARDRPNRPGGRQTRMNALCDTTEVLDSFQRTGRTPPEGEFGGRHSTDRLPPGQDQDGVLEEGFSRNPANRPRPPAQTALQGAQLSNPTNSWPPTVPSPPARATT